MVHLPDMAVWWELDGTSWNSGADGNGFRLLVERATGWTSSSPPRPDVQPRPNTDGGYRGPNYRGARIVELQGKAEAPTAAAREALADQLAALCSDANTLYPLTRHERTRDLTLWVELNDIIAVTERPDLLTLDVNLQLIAVDPVKYTDDNPTRTTGLASGAPGGVLWNGSPSVTGGTEWGGSPTLTGGLIYQSGNSDGGTITLTNTGTAWAPIRFVLTPIGGSLGTPTLTNVATGERITYGGTFTGILKINTGSGLTTLDDVDVGPLLTETDFFLVPPQGSIDVVFTALSGNGSLSGTNANAYA